MTPIRIYGLSVRNRPAAVALAAAALALGAVFIAFGIVLLLGLAVVGTLIGSGVLLYRALRGRTIGRLGAPVGDSDLDPSLEVFPTTAPPDSLARRSGTASEAPKLTRPDA